MNAKFKKILIISSVAVIIIGFVIWLFTRGGSGSEGNSVEMSPQVSSEINRLLDNLKKETGIDFSNIHSTTFDWAVEVDAQTKEISIVGKGFEAMSISNQKYREIESFFGKENFQVDSYNIAAGTVSGLIGYKKDKIVCVLISGATGYKQAKDQWIPPEPNKKDVDLKCGELKDLQSEINSPLYNWNTYKNKEYGYSFKYPSFCIYAYEELPESCQNKSLREMVEGCQCYLYENIGFVSLGYVSGTEPDFNIASFVVQRTVLKESRISIPGSDFVAWLREIMPYQDIPDKTNAEVAGIPAMRIRNTNPGDSSLFQENTFFLKNDVFFNIATGNVDNKENQELYDQIFSTFHF